MNSITRRKSAAAALCFFLLAICAVVWAASAGTPDAGEGPETALPLGNSFVRLSSGRAEAVCGGETAYSVDVTVDLLDENGETVTGVECYAFPYEFVEDHWVFTDFRMVY